MQLVADLQTRRQIAETAQQALDRHQPKGYRISVDREAILKDGDWYHYHIVVVTPGDVRDREFYNALAEAEAELQDEAGHQFLLVPAVAD